MLKSQLRKEIKSQLNKQTDAQRLGKSRLIENKLFQLAEFKQARCVLFYLAEKQEVQTQAMINAALKLGKQIAVPMILRREKRIVASVIKDFNQELTVGPYGILQPQPQYRREISNRKIDLVIVPGLAFDRQGNRLGRGAGYYDKFLAELPKKTPRIGLAFDFQVLENLPTLSHDIPVTRVISA